MQHFQITFESDHYLIKYEGNIYLRINIDFKLFGKLIFSFWRKDSLIFKCSYSSSLFHTKFNILYSDINSGTFQIRKINRILCMIHNDDCYVTEKIRKFNFLKNPIFNLYKNELLTGEVDFLKTVSVGSGLLYEVKFFEKDESNLWQLVFFILISQKSLMAV